MHLTAAAWLPVCRRQCYAGPVSRRLAAAAVLSACLRQRRKLREMLQLGAMTA